MRELIVDGQTVRFDSDGSWSWHGSTGELSISVDHGLLRVQGRAVARRRDLASLARALVGLRYSTPVHSVPGTVTAANIELDPSGEEQAVTLDSEATLSVAATGTFSLTVVPAMTPKGDPDTGTHTGTWATGAPVQTLLVAT
ncbi:MAG: hypothetical protein KDK91_10540 [Gammaproteobacteria bacterium]|nr:hypothetical protein [Gammaproteobacteria bacterium]